MEKEKEKEKEKDMVGKEKRPLWKDIGMAMKLIFISFVVVLFIIGGIFAIVYFIAWVVYPPLRPAQVVVSLIG